MTANQIASSVTKEMELMEKKVETKKAYEKPKFVIYGNVAELTKGGAIQSISDSGQNMMRPP